MAGRPNQPKCRTCKHAWSFHSNGKSRCKAMGCHCTKWNGIVKAVHAKKVPMKKKKVSR